MKISVLGAGAIGSMLGGLIKQHHPEADVLLVARGAHGEAIGRQQYVELRGPWGVFRPKARVSNDIQDIAGSDHVLFTVKSQDTRAVVEAANPYLGQAVVTSIQNGINHRTLAEYVSEDRLVMGTTVSNIAVLEPGCVELQLAGLTAIGSCPGQPMTAAATQAYELLKWSQLPVQLHEHILGMQYNKLLINCLGCASAISKLHFVAEGLFHRGWRRSVAWPIYSECLSVLERAGIQLAPVRGSTDARRFRFLMKALDQRFGGRNHSACRKGRHPSQLSQVLGRRGPGSEQAHGSRFHQRRDCATRSCIRDERTIQRPRCRTRASARAEQRS